MKKKVLLLGLLIYLIIPSNVFGLSVSAFCSGPSSVELGESFTVTITGTASEPTYWSGQSINSSGNLTSNSGTGVFAESDSSTSISKSYSFTANSLGTATINQILNYSDENYNEQSVTSSSCTVSIVEATRPNGGGSSSSYSNNDDDDTKEVDPDKSSNSYLKNLSIDGVKISPTFNKDKMEYTAVVSGDKDKINIKGELEDDKAKVEGLGEKELKEGINKFEIAVTAENGEVRKYVISVTRKESNPVEITINKKKYTVAKKDIGLKVPDGFTKTSVTIEKQEVDAYSNSFTGYLLVALIDEQGNASWYIYNQKNSTFTKYSEFKSSGLRLVILEANKKNVPHGYKKGKIEINNEIVDGYYLALGSKFRLVYALNMNTGEKNFYLYDSVENTFQRFDSLQVDIYRGLIKKLEIALIGLGSVIVIMLIIILSQFAANKKAKNFIRNGGKKEEFPTMDDEDVLEEREKLKEKIKEKSKKIDDNKKYKAIEVPKTIDEVSKESKKESKELEKTKTDQKPMTREEMRRLKKERKRELEEARRDFFDL